MAKKKLPKFVKIKSLLIEEGDTYQDFARILGRSVSTVQLRINGERSWEWEELQKIRLHYKLSDERFLSIFFNV